MTNRKQALQDLLAMVEAGEGLPIKYRHNARKHFNGLNQVNVREAYNGSLDAALALHNALLPGWTWMVERSTYNNKYEAWVKGENAPGYSVFNSDCPARALLMADLKAIMSGKEE